MKIEDIGFELDTEESRIGWLSYDDDDNPTYRGWFRSYRDHFLFLTQDGDLYTNSKEMPYLWFEIPREDLLNIAEFVKTLEAK